MSDLRKIYNPFIDHKGRDYQCFGCSPNNQNGLLMEFYSDGESVYADWKPQKHFEGYKNVIHGGIQATIMDEIAGWAVYAIIGTTGVTQKMEVNYHKPLYANNECIKVKASVKKATAEQAIIRTEIINAHNIVCCSADIVYFLFPLKIAKLKYHYPGKDAFWQ